ncbi:MAG TPA: M12 family metallo-peptidase [Blastocatellia bacterium]|nr:M12 family metallo-peptidase [Blastocatellia bacterium]
MRQFIHSLVCFILAVLAAVGISYSLPETGVLVSASSRAPQEPLWQEVHPGQVEMLNQTRPATPGDIATSDEPGTMPRRYKAFRLSEAALQCTLADAPLEFTEAASNSAREIELPMPDGALSRFRFVESPIMESGLAAQFPDVKTYRGWGIDDPAATVRFGRTGREFHAFVLTPRDAFYIVALSPNDPGIYVSYFARDETGSRSLRCGVGPANRQTPGSPSVTTRKPSPGRNPSGPPTTNVLNGLLRRTFRLAVAATGEYTGRYGSAADAMTRGIIPTIEFINGIYETDLAVHFNLVSNNSSIVFSDKNTDPYDTTDVSALLNQNQTTLDDPQFIGANNYDIGHVFDASDHVGLVTGAACDSPSKAKGTSTSINVNAGGAFDDEFRLMVAHELGHQLGSTHTFNSDGTDFCRANRYDPTAYEPGGGTTIMSYAGSCDSIGWPADPYFHGMSLAAMIAFLDTCQCAGGSITFNTPPSVLPLYPRSGLTGHYLIPARTPFTLTASASDLEDSGLTFCWEEFDHGSPGPPGVDRGDNPLFRSRPPVTVGTRTFPLMRDLLDGNTTPGETLPTTQRTLLFKVTVRDNHPGGGGFNQGDLIVDVWSQAGPFAITQPTATTKLPIGASLNVNWDVSGTSAGPINATNVRILLSTDDGDSFPITLAASTPNDGSFGVTLPPVFARKARVKVEAIDNIFFCVSPAFTISAPTITTTGSLTISQGGLLLTPLAQVATVDDGVYGPTPLRVEAVPPFPAGVSVSTGRLGAIVTATGTAQCNAIPATRSIKLRVTNPDGFTAETNFDLIVAQNPPPTLGTYNDATVIAGQSIAVTPSASPFDLNLNLTSITSSVVVPSLPTSNVIPSAGLSSGVVSIATTGAASLGTYQIQVVALDACGASATRTFFLTVINSPPQISTNGASAQTTQGGESLLATKIATTSDQQDRPETLRPSVTYPSTFPQGLAVSVTNSGGDIWATATADCTIQKGTYRDVTVTVRDTSGATASAKFSVVVGSHLSPRLGTYLNSSVIVGGTFTVTPTVAPSNPNYPSTSTNPNRALTVGVQPSVLPSGGQLTVQSNGNVTASTTGTTVLGVYQVIVTATDRCGAQTSRSFKLTVRSATCVLEQAAVIVADTGNNRVQRFGGAWNVIGAGTQGSGLGQFTAPEAAVASADGSKYYVADTGNRRIQWSTDGGGTWSVFASNLIPQGLVLDRDGNLYVSDARDNLVMRYAGGTPGTPTVLAGSGSTNGRVRNPNGLAIDCRMNLYIADTGNNRILVIANADSVGFPNQGSTFAGSGAGLNPAQVNAPQGVAVDDSGKLYVADTGNNRVLMIASAPSAGAATVLCPFGQALGQVRNPEGVTIATLAAGPLGGVESIIVSDTANSRIQGRTLAPGSWMLLPSPAGGGPGTLVGQFNLPSKIR